MNGIPTADGGTHVQGLKDAVRSAVRAYMETHDLMPKKLDITADDVREGLMAIINLFMVDPQFQGQTKDKLNNPAGAQPDGERSSIGARTISECAPDNG